MLKYNKFFNYNDAAWIIDIFSKCYGKAKEVFVESPCRPYNMYRITDK